MKLPRDIGPVHFVGIGGIGMSGIAEVLANLGYTVTGSDVADSANVKRLRDKGVKVAIGHKAGNIDGADVIVVSSAIKRDNPELVAARGKRLPVVRRAEMLAELMRLKSCVAVAGTHGKTTTTGMVIWLMKELGLPISYSIGTSISFGPPAQYQGGSEYFIYECDEFDRNFLEFHPYLSLVTAVDYDHPDTYPSLGDYQAAFKQFCAQSTYIFAWQDDSKVIGQQQNLTLCDKQDSKMQQITLPGHNRRNGWLAVNAVHNLTQRPLEALVEIINRFPGTSRRFEKLADNLYTDYAHVPEEISSTIDMALELNPNVTVVYQPHQNVRQHLLLQESGYQHCFDKAKAVYWLPTYLSREDGSEIIPPEKLVATVNDSSRLQPAEMNDELWQKIAEHRQGGDLVVGMSAGDLDPWLRTQIKASV